MSFTSRDNFVYCEDLRVKDILERVSASPFYLYSLGQITSNYQSYVSSLHGIPAIVSYAFKANANLAILEHLKTLGAGAVLVGQNELRLAMAAGFDAKRTVFNGNGKTPAELVLAAEHGVLVNVDSEFDLNHIEQAAGATGKTVDVMIRVNPDLDPDVHAYVSTGIRNSKFGVRNDAVPWFLERIAATPRLNLVGVHCHLGSTIADVSIFRDAAQLMSGLVTDIRRKGFDLEYLNLGGGLGIDYERRLPTPGPERLIDAIRGVLPEDLTLIVEPGRSIVANAGVLVTRVIGVKANGDKRFVVVDASMTELIRPSLYDAYHHIDFAEPVAGPLETFDIVGPVCESADFLGRARKLPTPGEGTAMVIYDAGAYGYVMSSNYNARMRPPEYLVDGGRLREIRRAETFDDYMRLFDSPPLPGPD